ncbi:hypothetical protein B2G71_22950 [Novosphingobium sp. PC22D]|uniref:WGR domain-containing protein n=2 Tax=Novosphingobium album (ex Hu et al. 2023) TaxID=2930093 RepID=A0ABT0B542_9SPHN|nr:WGR domain-containing protein [Novosphingobium sp. PC22D]MCJ2180145.1 WGR domain-containing protein [Novosphingobium album (ex Hu et al. 2023)]PEQ10329.1 hypothetical protein B2G71_22950 [Novosphingobium sp. PC22D]
MEALELDHFNLPVAIELSAIDASRNVHRAYSIKAGHDLFGDILIEVRWGRIGTAGHHRRYRFADAGPAECFVRRLLTRRSSAFKRIGVAYRQSAQGPINR